jgi:hypothetical protein
LVSSFKEVLSDFKKSISVDLATISSRISSLEAGHRVSLPTPCEKTGGLEPGRFKPIEEPGAEEKDPVVLIWLPFLPGFLLWKLTIGSHFPLLVRKYPILFPWHQEVKKLPSSVKMSTRKVIMNWLRPVSKGVNTLRARIRLGGYSPWWTSPSLHRRYGRTR